MGLMDLMAWMNASEAATQATTAVEKIEALEKKVDIIALELHKLQVSIEEGKVSKK
jgi:hypothetical protein